MSPLFNYYQSPPPDEANIIARFINEKKHNDSVKGFTILALEQMETKETLSKLPSGKINHFEIIWVKKGNTVLQINDVNFDFTENNIYIITPGNSRESISNVGIEGYYISFTSEFIRMPEEDDQVNYSWTDKYLNITAVLIDEELQHELEVIVRKMKREYNNYFNLRQELLKGLLHIFIIYFSRYLNEPRSVILHTREEELTVEFLNLVKKNFKVKKMVSDYASNLCVTPNYLNRTVKKATGFTASYHIQQAVIMEAKKRAVSAGIHMKEIAYHLGFETPAHFSKFFKNICGINFTDYKKGICI